MRSGTVAVIGRANAGKSTLVRCINLLERPQSGKVIVDGKDLLALQILALYLIKEICVTTVTYIIKDRFYCNSPMFAFEKSDQGGCGENSSHICSHICNDALQ